MPRQLVVVGNGMVGQRFVEAVRARDESGLWRLAVFAEEPRPAYDRVGLSAYFAGRSVDDFTLVPGGFYDDNPNVSLHLNETVTSIDRVSRTLRTSSGQIVRYDELVLATGSYPFVPPIEGAQRPGCFVYRTIDDLEAIESWAAGARHGVVIGGGLLGLEAANALHTLGLVTHVVELAPRLMPLQIDEGGGVVLRRRVEELGIGVHTGVPPELIDGSPAGPVDRVVLADGNVIPADIVVFASGTRPRDELARDCGLVLGPRGGVAINEECRTSDERIWAVGECACLAGRVYGLVAPGYQMADVAADRLTGGAALMSTPDTSTKLKLLGIDVASLGDAFAVSPGSLEIVYADPANKVYKKLVVTDAADRLLGAVLVGDASMFPLLRSLAGQPLPGPPERLLLPEGGAPIEVADGSPVCSCHSVTGSQVRCAIRDGQLGDVAGIKSVTKAGTGCGSCVPLLARLLERELSAAGQTVSRALCEHFEQSRAELFDILRVTGISTFSRLVTEFGQGRGCDICKPVVASLLASLYGQHVLSGDRAALQDTNDHVLANLQKDGSYSVVPRVPGGEISPEKLIAIGEVARDFSLYTKITGGQRIDLFGARLEQLPSIWRRLVDAGFESGHAYGKAVRTVKSCVGSTWCRYGVQDSVGLAISLELRYRGLRAPHKVKMGVSGCARECAEAQAKDIGVIATESGWNLYVAGNGGFRPRHADLFAQDLDSPTLVRYIDRVLMFYIRTADRLQRTATWLEGLEGGLAYLRRVVIDDSLGIGAELDEAMARHVRNYEDEWRAALDDPRILRQFVSFVNAPNQADSDIVFVRDRDQIRPATSTEKERGGVIVAGPRLEVVGR